MTSANAEIITLRVLASHAEVLATKRKRRDSLQFAAEQTVQVVVTRTKETPSLCFVFSSDDTHTHTTPAVHPKQLRVRPTISIANGGRDLLSILWNTRIYLRGIKYTRPTGHGENGTRTQKLCFPHPTASQELVLFIIVSRATAKKTGIQMKDTQSTAKAKSLFSLPPIFVLLWGDGKGFEKERQWISTSTNTKTHFQKSWLFLVAKTKDEELCVGDSVNSSHWCLALT